MLYDDINEASNFEKDVKSAALYIYFWMYHLFNIIFNTTEDKSKCEAVVTVFLPQITTNRYSSSKLLIFSSSLRTSDISSSPVSESSLLKSAMGEAKDP